MKIQIPVLLVLICIIFLSTFFAKGQTDEKGMFFTRNYSTDEYNGSPSNWCVLQDKRGVMYFGNPAGVLEFDGSEWRTIPIPNQTVVRSMAIDSTGVIYIGAVCEFGFLQPDNTGKLTDVSLSANLPDSIKKFSDVWKIDITDNGIYFSTSECIYIKKANRIISLNYQIRPLSTNVNKIYYYDKFNDKERIIYELEDTTLRILPGLEKFKNVSGSFYIASYDYNTLLILSSSHGHYTYNLSNGQLSNFKTEVYDYLILNYIYGLLVTDNKIYFNKL